MTALSAIRCGPHGVAEPKSVIVRAKATMRTFTREDVVAYAKGHGNHTVPNDAGGISLSNGGKHFYDTDKPLVISMQDDIYGKETVLARY